MSNDAKISVTWIELILLILVTAGSLGSWIVSRNHAGKVLATDAPREDVFERRHQVTQLQRQLTKAEEEWKVTLAERHKQHLAIERSAARIQSLETRYAALRDPATAATLPEEIQASYRKAFDEQAEAKTLESRLGRKLQEIEARLDTSSRAVVEARHAASRDLEQVQKAGSRDAAWKINAWGLAGAAAFLLLVTPFLWVGPVRRSGIRRGLLLAAVFSLLILLVLYELMAPLSLVVCSLITLLGLSLLLRRT